MLRSCVDGLASVTAILLDRLIEDSDRMDLGRLRDPKMLSHKGVEGFSKGVSR